MIMANNDFILFKLLQLNNIINDEMIWIIIISIISFLMYITCLITFAQTTPNKLRLNKIEQKLSVFQYVCCVCVWIDSFSMILCINCRIFKKKLNAFVVRSYCFCFLCKLCLHSFVRLFVAKFFVKCVLHVFFCCQFASVCVGCVSNSILRCFLSCLRMIHFILD